MPSVFVLFFTFNKFNWPRVINKSDKYHMQRKNFLCINISDTYVIFSQGECMLDTHRLRVFLIAAETLNFSVAAKRLHLTQPSVSQHIQALEQKFGTDLFVRSGRRLCLTEAGAVLVPMAEKMVSMAMHAQEVMSNLKGEVHGHLQVGCSTTPGKYMLPKLLSTSAGNLPGTFATRSVKTIIAGQSSLSIGQYT